jgi:iron complex transport system substrate-binding protein
MPALIATLAGGRNIFDDIPNSYVRVSWEEVVQRDPQWILVSDDRLPASRQIAHLLRDPQLRDVEAVKKRQFILVTYPQRSPSTRNVETVERVARALHPEAFEP